MAAAAVPRRFGHRPELAPETSLLVERMMGGRPGDVLTDDELEALAGVRCAPASPGYRYLRTAERYVEREHGVVWKREHGQGRIVCCTPEQVIGLVENDHRHVKRTAHRSGTRLKALNGGELPEGLRRRRDTLAVVTALLKSLSRPSTVEKIETGQWSKPPSTRKLLELMRDGEKRE